MASGMTVSYRDVNGITASNRFAIGDPADGPSLLAALDALTNAAIVESNTLTPVDLTGLSAASATNNESAKFKMAITMSGPIPTGGTVRPKVIIQIPAPLGTLINGLSGDPTNALFTALLAFITTNRGETLDKVDSVNYVR
jgi:hypothetical protein